MRQEERRARTRTALLRAASAAFAERGYDGASLDAIAASVGLSKGAVYAHFPSKVDLFLGVVESLVEQAEWRLERVSRAIESGSTAMSAARAYEGLGGDAQHAALMSELWRAAAIEPQFRATVERFVQTRMGVLAKSALERGLNPAQAIDLAETVARLIDAELLYRRVDAAGQAHASGTA